MMLRRFLALPSGDWLLLVRAGMLVAGIRVALWLLPFPWVRNWSSTVTASSLKTATAGADRFVWAVRAAARRVPKATCLTQALALQRLLAGAGKCVQVQIGVSLAGQSGRFEAHAWAEHDGLVLIGDNGKLHHYTPIYCIRSL
jgi:Transglutaminase-like superfamily